MREERLGEPLESGCCVGSELRARVRCVEVLENSCKWDARLGVSGSALVALRRADVRAPARRPACGPRHAPSVGPAPTEALRLRRCGGQCR